MISNLASEKIWTDKSRFDQAESKYYQLASKHKIYVFNACCQIKDNKTAINCCNMNGKNKIDVNTVINTSGIDVAANNQNDDAYIAKIKTTTKNKKINKQEQANANINANANIMINDENTTEVTATVMPVNNKKNKKKLHKIQAKQQALEWKQQVLELKQEVEHLKLQVDSEAGNKLVVTTDNTKMATMNSSDKLCSFIAKAKVKYEYE